ncbi:MAG TPA: YtxH domain-containing protein [Agromyces sp.]|nr:YtxH domain-containing protein [Agromyces sp.]
MRGKILFVVGLGVGYVLGTRAGRERYEQIRKAAENVWNTPAVQQGVGTVKDFATARVGDLSDTVLDGVKSFIGNATKSSGATKSDVSSAARSAKSGVSKSAQAARSAVDTAADAIDDVIDQAAKTATAAASASTSASKPRSTPSSRGKTSSSDS